MSTVYLKPFDLFTMLDKYFVIRIRTLFSSEITREEYEWLSGFKGAFEIEVDDAQEKTLERLRLVSDKLWSDETLRAEEKARWDVFLGRMQVRTIELMVAQECNMRCVYCYGSGGHYQGAGFMSRETAFVAIDMIAKSWNERPLSPEGASRSDDDGPGVNFFGGEPLMNYPLIRECVEYSEGIFGKGHVKFSMTTNLTLATDEMLAYFKEHSFDILVSFDGPREYQTHNRPLNDGRDSYDVTLDAIARAKKYYPELGGCATFLPGQDEALIAAEFDKVGLRSGHIRAASGNMAEHTTLSGSRNTYLNDVRLLNELPVRFFDAVHSRDVSALRALMRESQPGMTIADVVKRPPLTYWPIYCGSGIPMVCVNVDGDIYPCHRLTGVDGYKLGNLKDGYDRKMFAHSRTLENPRCWGCMLRHICRGVCAYECACDVEPREGVLPIHNVQEPFCERERLRYRLTEYMRSCLTSDELAWIRKNAFKRHTDGDGEQS